MRVSQLIRCMPERTLHEFLQILDKEAVRYRKILEDYEEVRPAGEYADTVKKITASLREAERNFMGVLEAARRHNPDYTMSNERVRQTYQTFARLRPARTVLSRVR